MHADENLEDQMKFHQDQQDSLILVLKTEIETPKNDIAPSTMCEELELRSNRQRNLIFSGVPEPAEGSLMKRKEADEQKKLPCYRGARIYKSKRLLCNSNRQAKSSKT